MILDKFLELDPTGTAVTVTADSTNVIDLLNARDMGIGDDPAVMLTVQSGTAFTAAGAATLTIALRYSEDNITYYTAAQTAALPVASLTANKRLWTIPLPWRPEQMGDTVPRYMKLVYTVATGPFLTGTIYAAMLLDPAGGNKAYPPGIVIAN